jgi:hypothetical protein
MSDDKKKDTKDKSEFLDFSELDGGTVADEKDEKIRDENLPTVHSDDSENDQEYKYLNRANFLDENEVTIAIPVESNKYKITNIYDITGEEFITWLRSLPLIRSDWKAEAAQYDGPDNVYKRINQYERAVQLHINIAARGFYKAGIELDKIIH